MSKKNAVTQLESEIKAAVNEIERVSGILDALEKQRTELQQQDFAAATERKALSDSIEKLSVMVELGKADSDAPEQLKAMEAKLIVLESADTNERDIKHLNAKIRALESVLGEDKAKLAALEAGYPEAIRAQKLEQATSLLKTYVDQSKQITKTLVELQIINEETNGAVFSEQAPFVLPRPEIPEFAAQCQQGYFADWTGLSLSSEQHRMNITLRGVA